MVIFSISISFAYSRRIVQYPLRFAFYKVLCNYLVALCSIVQYTLDLHITKEKTKAFTLLHFRFSIQPTPNLDWIYYSTISNILVKL